MPELLALWHESGDITRHHPDYQHLLTTVIDTVVVKVTALSRSQPWPPSMVIVTGGFRECIGNVGDTFLPLLMHDRTVQSHNPMADDLVSVVLQTETAPSPNLEGKFLGLELSLLIDN